jgi:DNA-directed RNA polymerase specialized sigma24 family protein
MAFQRISSSQRHQIQAIVNRAWAAGLTDATFSQVLKDTAGWTRQIHQAVEAAKAPKTATEIITQLRAAGRSVREIAQMVNVHASTVYRWARGAFKPQAARLAALAAI